MDNLAELQEEQLEETIVMVEDVYRFVLNVYDVYSSPRNYGTGRILNLVEIHTLAMIADEPGLRVTDIAKRWNRTLGAASRNVNRLCKKGYVEKKKLPGDDKTIHIYPTELGVQLAALHAQYDREMILKGLPQLLSKHSMEELRICHKVLMSFEDFVLQ